MDYEAVFNIFLGCSPSWDARWSSCSGSSSEKKIRSTKEGRSERRTPCAC
jgi:hypothetical protein